MSAPAAAAMRVVLQQLKAVNDLLLHAGNRAEMLTLTLILTLTLALALTLTLTQTQTLTLALTGSPQVAPR